MPLDATIDHVAVAVHSIADAGRFWHDELGGGWVGGATTFEGPGFTARQLRFAGGGRLELLEPVTHDGFVRRFLGRFGPRVHHVTLKVPDLLDAVADLEAAGYPPVDVSTALDDWHEAFLRPSQVGGMVVQVATSRASAEDWARHLGGEVEAPRGDAPALLGPTLRHPDLGEAARLWSTLGASVCRDHEVLEARWPSGALTIRIEPGQPPGPIGLRFDGVASLPDGPEGGPRILTG